jgi:hypothetical protein
MHGLAAEAAKERAGAAGKEFRASVAAATARAMGARYKPEIAAAVAALPKKTADGIAVDFALDNLKVGGGEVQGRLLFKAFAGRFWVGDSCGRC